MSMQPYKRALKKDEKSCRQRLSENQFSVDLYKIVPVESLYQDHSVYSIFEKTGGHVINRCLQTHVPFRG